MIEWFTVSVGTNNCLRSDAICQSGWRRGLVPSNRDTVDIYLCMYYETGWHLVLGFVHHAYLNCFTYRIGAVYWCMKAIDLWLDIAGKRRKRSACHLEKLWWMMMNVFGLTEKNYSFSHVQSKTFWAQHILNRFIEWSSA